MPRLPGIAAALALLGVLTLALARYGATQDETLYRVGILLLAPGVLACLRVPVDRIGRVPAGLLALVGAALLAQAALRPTLEARGYLLAAVGWIGLIVALWLGGDRGLRRTIVLALLALAAAESIYGLVQAVGGVDKIFDYTRRLGRIATGTFINRNHFAGFLNMTLALGFGVLFATWGRGVARRQPISEVFARVWLVILACSLIGLGLVFSHSRGGVLTLAATAVFVALVLERQRRRRAAGSLPAPVAALLLGVILLLGLLVGMGSVVGRFVEGTEVSRLRIYGDSLRLIAEHPWLGVGPGMFEWRFRAYQTLDTDKWVRHAHNDYLQVAADWGVPLALLFWGFLVWRLRRSIGRLLDSRDPGQQGMALGCAAAIFGILVHSLVDFNLHIPANLLVFATIVGLAWGAEADAAPAPAEESRSWMVPAVRWLLVLLMVAAGWRLWGRLMALEAAGERPDPEALAAALAWDPANARMHALLGTAYRDRPDLQDLEASESALRRAVELHPFNWRYQVELARTLEARGKLTEAETALVRAVEIHPRSGTAQWQLANAYLRWGKTDRIDAPLRAAVRADPSLEEPTLGLLAKLGASPERIASVWPDDPKARLRLLRGLGRHLRGRGDPRLVDLAVSEFGRLLDSDRPPSIATGGFFVEDLLAGGETERARRLWIALARAEDLVDPDFEAGRNAIWNGSFELPLSGGPFDWRLARSRHFELRRVIADEASPSGPAAVELRFTRPENLVLAALEQQIVVQPAGRYRLSLRVRTAGLTTDQRPYLELFDVGGRRRLAVTEQFPPETEWREVETTFEVPAEASHLVVRLRRDRSRRIDSRIRGSVLLDDLRLAMAPPAAESGP